MALLCLSILTATGIGLAAYHYHRSRPMIAAPPDSEVRKADYLTITGLSGTVHQDGHTAKRFSIGRLSIAPKKIFLFSVGRFYTLTLDEMDLEVIQSKNDKKLNILETINFVQNRATTENPTGKPGFQIVEALIHDFTLKITNSKEPPYTVTAQKALLDSKNRGLKLFKVTFTDPATQETIQCPTARLSDDGVLRISGEHRIASPAGVNRKTGRLEKKLITG